MNDAAVTKIIELFKGLESAHGIFIPTKQEGKKQIGKASTVREPVTRQMWEAHLLGRVGLGIIPINEENECWWCVIDIDNYDLDIHDMFNKVHDTPFVMCRSKSGGFHLFIFFKERTSCKQAREYLRSQVSVLGFGNSEIFPKQDEIIHSRGDVGNWLNMPYFGDTRQCVINTKEGPKELEIDDFLEYAFNKRTTIKEVQKHADKLDYTKSPIKDGPPCLQTMSMVGFPQGTRNISLFNLGVYAKKAFPNEWVKVVEKYNKMVFDEPLLSREVQVVLKSLDKKEYFYQCNVEPLCSFCNPALCRTRKYGIAGSAAMPIINSVTKVAGDMSIWFLDVEGGRLELTTEELYDNRKFRIKCVNALNTLPGKLKDEIWQEYLQQILDKAVIVNDDGMFKRTSIPDYFMQFMLSRVTDKHEEIGHGRVLFDKRRQEVLFKMDSFINFLQYKKIQIEKGWLVMYFKSRGAKSTVGKDRDRKSFRYSTMHITDEECQDLETKMKLNEVM